MAQWIRRLPTEQKILGSNPSRSLSISSLVVKYMPSKHRLRVRFPADALQSSHGPWFDPG